MLYKNYLFLIPLILITNCTTTNFENNRPDLIIENKFTNKGFTLIYEDDLYNKKIISKKIDERELVIFQKNLKKGSKVKITNILNNKSLIANVGRNSKYPSFNNSVISKRIANELNLDVEEPYIEIILIPNNSLFVAKKAVTYEEEKKVANKVPVNSISINDLNKVKTSIKKKTNRQFSYLIKIADFYYRDTASMMVNRITNETRIKSPKVKKITNRKYRVYLGPFDNIYSLQKSFNDINILKFENIEIIKND